MTVRSRIASLLRSKRSISAPSVVPNRSPARPPTSRQPPAPNPSTTSVSSPTPIPSTPRSTTLILVSSTANSNKFYRLTLDADGAVSKTFGRVGASGVTNVEHTGYAGYERMRREKLRKGYREIDVADGEVTAPRIATMRLASVARSGLTENEAGENAVISDLIDRIVRVNAHDILETSGGLMKVDTSGRITTPVGLVTAASIREATALLKRMQRMKAAARVPLLEQYLTLVPQKVSPRAGWADVFFEDSGTFQKQREFLEQLADSVAFFETQAAALAAAPENAPVDVGFKYRIRSVPDRGGDFKRIRTLFESTKNDMHTASRLKLKRVFELVDPVGADAYQSVATQIRNEQQLWHGTRAANLLSILRRGLYVPPTTGSTVQIAGRMFGDGVYLSSQSSKALNYSHGIWTSGRREDNCFMLLADVAMGSEYRPGATWDAAVPQLARTTRNKFDKPWNSINVRPGHGGVRNHEAIVWNVDQIRVRYLCEFDGK
jgi:poly [ADP-ribose] polymerase 2/3/4